MNVKIMFGAYEVEVDQKYEALARAFLKADVYVLDILDDPNDPKFTNIIFRNSDEMMELANIMTEEGLSIAMFAEEPGDPMIGSVTIAMNDDGYPFCFINTSIATRFVKRLTTALEDHVLGIVEEAMTS